MPEQNYDNKGYIPIPREIFSGPRASEKRKFSPFEAQLDLYQSARYGTTRVRQLIGGKMVSWGRGELPASIRYLATRWQWSKDRVDRFLAQLIQENEIEIRQDAGQTIVAVCMLTGRGQQQGQQQGQQEAIQNSISEDGKDSGQAKKRTRTGHRPDSDKDKTVIKKDKENKEKRDEEGAAAPAPPGKEKELNEKQKAMLTRREQFTQELAGYLTKYSKDMINAFYKYWTEPNKSRSKMKFEMEATWDLSRRLSTLEQRDQKWNKGAPGAAQETDPADDLKRIEALYRRFLDGSFQSKYVTEKDCDRLLTHGLIQLEKRFILHAVTIRINNLTGTNQASELRMIEAYQNGSWSEDQDCRADEPSRTRVAKKLAMIEFFKQLQTQAKETVFDAQPRKQGAEITAYA